MRRAETMIEVKIHLHCFSVSPACLCLGCMNMGCVWCVCVCEREKKKADWSVRSWNIAFFFLLFLPCSYSFLSSWLYSGLIIAWFAIDYCAYYFIGLYQPVNRKQN